MATRKDSTCDYCKKVFTRKSNLEVHMETQHCNTITKLKCPLWPICKHTHKNDGTFSTMANLRVHYRRQHRGRRLNEKKIAKVKIQKTTIEGSSRSSSSDQSEVEEAGSVAETIIDHTAAAVMEHELEHFEMEHELDHTAAAVIEHELEHVEMELDSIDNATDEIETAVETIDEYNETAGEVGDDPLNISDDNSTEFASGKYEALEFCCRRNAF